jgi:tetratricopeptide (TPR) repeat protein
MRLRTRNLAFALAATLIATFAVSTARAQAPVPIEGTVFKAGSREPVVGATVDIYRTDIKGKYEAKTDKRGVFTYPVPLQGTYLIVVSSPGFAPQFQQNLHVGGPKIEFGMPAGAGQRPSLEDVQKALKGGGSAEDPKAAEERAKAEAEHAKALESKSKFDVRKTRFDAGIAAMNNKDYPTAITELTAATEGLEDADPEFFGELASVGGTNLAETQYRVAVDLFNKKQREEAKAHLDAAAKAIALAVKFNPNNESSYAIQGKVLGLLVEKYNDTDDAQTGAAAFLKAAELETADPKKKALYIAGAANVYRAGYMTDKAIETYKQALALDPSNNELYYWIGLTAMATAEEDLAKRKVTYQTGADYLKAFLDKSPADPQKAAEAKGALDQLAADPALKIKPRPIK